MKTVLVTGAAGTIGKKLIKYLLSEGKYEIIAVDLKSRSSHNFLKKYRKRIEVVYADAANDTIMVDLIKKSNYVIHLAGTPSPFINLNTNLPYEIDFKTTESIVRIIDFYNSDCHLLYASSSCVYGNQKDSEVSTSTSIDIDKLGKYAKNKLDSEELIKEKLKNYSIYRLPIILCNPLKENFVFDYKKEDKFEVVTDDDVAYMFTRALDKIDKVNKKTFNVGAGEHGIVTGKELNDYMFKTYGYVNKYLSQKLFFNRLFYPYIFKDSDKLEKILSYRNDSVASFFMKEKRKTGKHYIRKIFGKLFNH